MSSATNDLTVAGVGSPYSVQKVLKHLEETNALNELTLLVENEGVGFKNDEPELVEISVEGRLEQAAYFRQQYTGKIPAYLFRYLHYMFIGGEEIKYPTTESVTDAIRSGQINSTSEEYIHIDNLIRYSDSNKEAAQLIGFIMMMVYMLSTMQKMNSYARIYIEHPETDLHPKRQSRFMSLFHKIKSDYGGGQLSSMTI